jgi:solute carrier family 12 (potassium/chloride transporter), member 4/6
VIIFMRINYIVGEAGIFQSFVILFFSCMTTFLTVLSMSAIATNGKIRTGGVYYMISRSLGPSTGGSIGILYYLATTFSAAMSILGSIEAIHVAAKFSLGPMAFSMRFFSFMMLGALAVTNLFGARFVNRAGTVLIFFVFVSILSMVIGLFSSKSRGEDLNERIPGLTGIDASNFRNNWGSDYQADSFYTLHAIFFNACTGILQGANSSSNLKDPISAIPKGTLMAHLSTFLLYVLLFILFGCAGDREALRDLSVIIGAEVAWPHRWIVYIGIILSSSGSALQTI